VGCGGQTPFPISRSSISGFGVARLFQKVSRPVKSRAAFFLSSSQRALERRRGRWSIAMKLQE
jgi:hypothetical protein